MATDPIAATQEFLQHYCADADEATELVNYLEVQIMINAGPVLQGLMAIEDLLSSNLLDNETCLNLVTQNTNIKLKSLTEETAQTWLIWLAEQIRMEISQNLLPFQPVRALLQQTVAPKDERFPHDLRLYPSDGSIPEYWHMIWQKENIFYADFLKTWDGQTCPNCKTPAIYAIQESKYVGETSSTPYNTRVTYDNLRVYKCSSCNLGWTERTGTRQYTEVDFPN